MKKFHAMIVMACIFVGVLTGTAAAQHVFHTYNTGCEIKVSGFEHWGKAASSTRDNNAACWEIQTRLKYQDSDNREVTATAVPVTDGYTRIVAGYHTDWVQGDGRSPSIDGQWFSVIR